MDSHPITLLKELYLLDIVCLIYEDVHLTDRLPLAYKVYLCAAGSISGCDSISFLVKIKKSIRIHALLAGRIWIGYVYLVSLLVIDPLGLAVIPHNGFRRAGTELIALDRDVSGIAELVAGDREIGSKAL